MLSNPARRNERCANVRNNNNNNNNNGDDEASFVVLDDAGHLPFGPEPDLADMPEPEQEPEEPFYCSQCNEIVCIWLQLYGFVAEMESIVEPPRVDDEKADRSRARKVLYRAITMHLFGPLGRGNRVKLPACVLEGVRAMYPDPDEQYMGHYDS